MKPWYFYTSTSYCAQHCGLSLLDEEMVDACYFPHDVSNIVIQMYSHSILVMFVVLLAKCLKQLTNARTPYVLVHVVAAHTAFDYELVTRGNDCTWSLCHVHFH